MPSEAKLPLGRAIGYYVLANEAWQGRFKVQYMTYVNKNQRNDELISACPDARAFFSEYAEDKESIYVIAGPSFLMKNLGRTDASARAQAIVEMSVNVFWLGKHQGGREGTSG